MAPITTFDYYVQSTHFPNNHFNVEGTWNQTSFSKFACRFASLKILTVEISGSEWNSKLVFLQKHFPENVPLKEFGYNSETSICMPRLYPATDHSGWQYTLTIITMNIISFIAIIVSYVVD